ncbi:hypothetical protein HK104_002378 [Borealophlyctis nickersoniae]|nr:hypothetical protein HK104_002378 [Borealophlyctis nickersoniae]
MVVLSEAQVLGKARGTRGTGPSDLSSVRNLNLWGQNLTDVSVLRKLPNLEVLSLALNSISSLLVFRDIRNLTELYLRRNQIADPRELFHLCELPRLRVLWLSENPISNIPGYRQLVLRVLPNLETLDDRDVLPSEREEAQRAGPIRIEDLRATGQSQPQQRYESPYGANGGDQRVASASAGMGGPQGLDRRTAGPFRPPSELGIHQAVIHDRVSDGKNMPSLDEEFPVNVASPSSQRMHLSPQPHGGPTMFGTVERQEDHLQGPGLGIVSMPHRQVDARRRRRPRRYNNDGTLIEDDAKSRIYYISDEDDDRMTQTSFCVQDGFPAVHLTDAMYSGGGAGVGASPTRKAAAPQRSPRFVQPPALAPSPQNRAPTPRKVSGEQAKRNRPSWLTDDAPTQIKESIRAASTDAVPRPPEPKRASFPVQTQPITDDKPKNSNVLFAVLSLIKELDPASLQVVGYEIGCILTNKK